MSLWCEGWVWSKKFGFDIDLPNSGGSDPLEELVLDLPDLRPQLE